MKELLKGILYVTVGVLVGLLIGGGIWLTASQPRGEAVALLPTATPSLTAVYVSGAVVSPGLYYLPEGSRIGDAIDAAGGFAVTAQRERVNLAALLDDGEQIDVPGVGANTNINLGRININTATVEELETLPGIGETAAQNIVNYRNDNGPFDNTLDIQDVPGIGSATYEMIKNMITVDD